VGARNHSSRNPPGRLLDGFGAQVLAYFSSLGGILIVRHLIPN